MDFVKKHYEKVILSAVLLGVVGFLAFLPIVINHEHDELERIKSQLISLPAKPLPPLDLTPQAAISQRVKVPANYDFSTTNRLFNPLEWKRAPDGTLFPIKSGNETGAGAAVVTKITPLYFILTFDSVETNGMAPRYFLGVERVENYSADLKYDLEKPAKNFAGLRAGSRLSFGFEDYIVVAVDADEVIL